MSKSTLSSIVSMIFFAAAVVFDLREDEVTISYAVCLIIANVWFASTVILHAIQDIKPNE